MSLKKHGVVLDCEHCTCSAADGHCGFDIEVPVGDVKAGVVHRAKIHCTVSPGTHKVELKKWQDADGQSIRPSGDLEQRVSAMLEFVADHRVCGNRNICPSDVIQIVEKASMEQV